MKMNGEVTYTITKKKKKRIMSCVLIISLINVCILHNYISIYNCIFTLSLMYFYVLSYTTWSLHQWLLLLNRETCVAVEYWKNETAFNPKMYCKNFHYFQDSIQKKLETNKVQRAEGVMERQATLRLVRCWWHTVIKGASAHSNTTSAEMVKKHEDTLGLVAFLYVTYTCRTETHIYPDELHSLQLVCCILL